MPHCPSRAPPRSSGSAPKKHLRTPGQLIRHLVRDLDELIALLPRLLTAKAELGLSGAQLLLQTTPAGAYSHLIYISGELPAPAELSALGHLTALVCGTDFNEADYQTQLSELTI